MTNEFTCPICEREMTRRGYVWHKPACERRQTVTDAIIKFLRADPERGTTDCEATAQDIARAVDAPLRLVFDILRNTINGLDANYFECRISDHDARRNLWRVHQYYSSALSHKSLRTIDASDHD